MKINSGRLGEIEIDAAEILTFADGVIGFPDYKRYIELEFLENSPLKLLQAVDMPELSFIIIDPLLFEPGYVADITKKDLASLKTDDPAVPIVRTIVTIPEDSYEMTANLQGPIVINSETKLAMQIVNHNQKYTTKHRILKNNKSASEAK